MAALWHEHGEERFGDMGGKRTERVIRQQSSQKVGSMLYFFPQGTSAVAISDYARPYADPITVIAGEVVRLDPFRSAETDFMGWVWCIGSDRREGWVPLEWIDRAGAEWRMLRDFSALELDVKKGDQFDLHFSESGFIYATSGSRTGWVPDAVVVLASS